METSKPNFIVIVAACPFPFGNASDNAIYTFMAGFNEHGCNGEVVCLYPNLPKEFDFPYEGNYLGVKYRYLHGKAHRSKSRIRNRIDIVLLSRLLFRRYLKKISKLYQVTALFITHVGYKYYRDTRFCHSLGIKTVLVSCEYPEYLIQNTPKRLKQFNKYSSHTDKYIFETKTLDDYTRNALKQDIKSIVIPATMQFEDIIQCKRTETNPYIAYCGSIHSEEKDGLKKIIKAYASFHQYFPNVKLKFIGRISRYNYFEQLKQLVGELNLQDNITFVGGVNREEYIQYLTNSQLMIVAKPKNSYYGGGLSSKVIEYLFSGNPVLMTNADDYVYYLTHGLNVFFVNDNQPDTISSALIDLFNHPEQMKTIGEKGKKYAMENFNYHKLTKNLLYFLLN